MWAQNQIKRTLSEPHGLERVAALLRRMPDAHRTAIADEVCAAFGFVDPRGRAQRASCLKGAGAMTASTRRARRRRRSMSTRSRAIGADVSASPAQHGPLEPGEGVDGESWAHNEFGAAPLGDKRLSRRLVDSAQRQGEDPLRAFTGVARGD